MQVHYILKSVVMLQILEKLYHPKHIAIAHELIKLVSILLSLGDGASAAATFARAEAIFSVLWVSYGENFSIPGYPEESCPLRVHLSMLPIYSQKWSPRFCGITYSNVTLTKQWYSRGKKQKYYHIHQSTIR